MDTSDDAAVYKLNESQALIQTLDFFTPMVDDPYTYGQVAAANSLSDIYAMGGTPIVAMNIVCYPSCNSMDVLSEILRGGMDKVKESGALLVGGHTVDDKEPKYGLSVSGLVDPNKVLTNADARVGDKLIITKPLGMGILNNAYRGGILDDETEKKLINVMTHLNKYAAQSFDKFDISSVTDITGFGLLGHAFEMAKGSGTSLIIDSKKVPIIPQTDEMAKMGMVPAGAYNNMGYIQDNVEISGDVEEYMEDILYDPQTSGGLLVAVRPDQAEDLCADMLNNGSLVAVVVGEVIEKKDNYIYVK